MLYSDIRANVRKDISSWPCQRMREPDLLKCFSAKCFPVFVFYVHNKKKSSFFFFFLIRSVCIMSLFSSKNVLLLTLHLFLIILGSFTVSQPRKEGFWGLVDLFLNCSLHVRLFSCWLTLISIFTSRCVRRTPFSPPRGNISQNKMKDNCKTSLP